MRRSRLMLMAIPLTIGVMALFATGSASAQSINLTGVFKCIQMCRGGMPVCRGGMPAYVTQNGAALNLLTEAGVASRAWPDWYAPYNRIWVDAFNESAVYSPDGMLIQFDNGTIWQRDLPPPPPPLRRRY
jgi:hypothetical protein